MYSLSKVKEVSLLPAHKTTNYFNCFVCKQQISPGDSIYNGGYNKRAHSKCVQLVLNDDESSILLEAQRNLRT